MLLLIDNYDSFTFNLLHRLGERRPGLRINVVRNDAITPRRAAAMNPLAIVVSPGPCGPRQAGVSVSLMHDLAGRIPMLGVCLGHQCLAEAFGMRIQRHTPVHGKTSPIHHDGRTVFRRLPSPLVAMRYHSLIVDPASIPDGWQVSAWTDESSGPDHSNLVMGLRREWPAAARLSAPVESVQFHPESFRTPLGTRLLDNFLRIAEVWRAGQRPAARAPRKRVTVR